MKQLTLERFAYTPMGTFGRLRIGERFLCYTLEEVWANNEKGKSCIPIGLYVLKRGFFPKHKEAFEVTDVLGRTAILIHIANTVADIEGCIGPGLRLGCLGGQWAVLDSGDAYRLLMRELAGQDEALLRIVNNLNEGVVI